MPRCAGCDGFVSSGWARVFADDSGTVNGCRGCATLEELSEPQKLQGPEGDDKPGIWAAIPSSEGGQR